MKIKARYSVELNGHIYHKGDTLDFGGVVDSRIADNFTAMDGAPLKAGEGAAQGAAAEGAGAADDEQAKIAKAVSVIGRDGIMRKLDDLGITYKPTHRTDYLAKLMLSAQGEIEAQ